MVYLPELKTAAMPLQKQIIDFKGYSVAPVIEDGEMREMLNLSADMYPNLSQRKARGYYTIEGKRIMYPEIECMLVSRGKLAVITKEPVTVSELPGHPSPLEVRFAYGASADSETGQILPTWYALSIDPDEHNHQMVAINNKIVIYPEKVWFDVNTQRSGMIEFDREWDFSVRGDITIENDTTSVCTVTLGTGGLGAIWLKGLTVQDTIDIIIEVPSGNTTTTYTFTSTIKEIKANKLILPADTFLTMLDGESSMTLTAGDGFKIQRLAPDLDFVMESNNRLWGCKGNTIYASKLGDPTNWNYYQTLSVDSYAVDVGTDGEFTGCCAYSNHLLFFKENYIHKVYGTQPSNYSIQTAECYGLEAGSEKSVCTINDTIFYKSKLGIMAYQGSLPEHISQNFGNKSYYNAIAGTDGLKYYVSMKTTGGARETLVFDLDKRLWHKEEDLDPVQFAFMTNDQGNAGERETGNYHNQLLYIHNGEICSVDPYIPFKSEEDLYWMAMLGSFDEYMEQKKIYSKIRMRLRLDSGSELTISIKHDQGEWREMQHIYANDDQVAYVPISPIRCDKFYIKLEGHGRCVVESLQRDYRERSDR